MRSVIAYISLGCVIFGVQFLYAATSKLDERSIEVGDLSRSYYIRYPKSDDAKSSFPLIIVLHGGGRDNGNKIAKMTGFDEMSDKEGFISVFPNGVKNKWHDGRLPKRKQKKYIKLEENDITFLTHLIDELITHEQVNPDRVYMTGLSNGGMMTIRMACEISEKLAAVAAIIANMPLDIVEQCKPKTKLSFLLMNGTEDPLVPWKGGEVKAFAKKRGKVISTEQTLDFWLKYNICEDFKSTVFRVF